MPHFENWRSFAVARCCAREEVAAEEQARALRARLEAGAANPYEVPGEEMEVLDQARLQLQESARRRGIRPGL